MAGLKGLARRIPCLARSYRQRDRARGRIAEVLAERRAALDARNAAVAASAAAAKIQKILLQEVAARTGLVTIATTHALQAELRTWIADLAPSVADGAVKLRVGADHDGGYVMADDFAGVAGAVSAGVGPDVSWDLDIAARGIPVIQVDHTVDAPPQSHPLFSFRREKLVPDGVEAAGTVTLSRILAAAPFDRPGDAVLKIDIEHDEWDVLDAAEPRTLARFRQIVVEFHWLERFADSAWRARARRVTAKLAATHRSIHFHGNNAAPFAVIGNVPLPRVVEVSYLRVDGRRFRPGDRAVPGPLDRPNNTQWPDLVFNLPPPA